MNVGSSRRSFITNPAFRIAPGGGAAVSLLDPEQLAAEVLEACRRGRPELTRPWKAAILAGLIEWFPAWGRRLLARFTARSNTDRADG